MDILDQLKKPFKSIKWRCGARTKDKKKGIPLAYIDSRDVMKRLDDVVGIDSWQCRYSHPGICDLGIKIKDEWIWKANGAGETKVEAEKGQASDAFKRAAVLWGIGRYLYYIPNEWIEIDEYGNFKKEPTLPSWAQYKEEDNE